MNNETLYNNICTLLTDYETENNFDISEWYNVMVEIQNKIKTAGHSLRPYTYAYTRPISSTWYRLMLPVWISEWQFRQTSSKLFQDKVIAGSVMFSGVMCILWWTISPGTYNPLDKHLSHNPRWLLTYAARVDFHSFDL